MLLHLGGCEENPGNSEVIMTLAQHAEAWWREQGKEVPPRDTREWQEMYEQWVAWAFNKL